MLNFKSLQSNSVNLSVDTKLEQFLTTRNVTNY